MAGDDLVGISIMKKVGVDEMSFVSRRLVMVMAHLCWLRTVYECDC